MSDPEPEIERGEEDYYLNMAEHNGSVNNIIHRFFYKERKLTDVTLATETDTFKAHQLILSACSPYFRNLFLDNSCEHPIVHFKDIPASHMEPLIEFMYTGETCVKRADLTEILKSARILEIDSLDSFQANPESPGDNGYKTDSRPSTPSSGQSSNSGKRKAGGGRKSANPKRLRPELRPSIGEERRSPMFGMMGACLPQTSLKPAPSPEKEKQVITPTRPSCSYDDIAASEDEGELVIDQQPVDFSAARPSPAPAVYSYKPVTPATGDLKPKSLESLQMATPVMGTWEQQLAKLAMATANKVEDEKVEKKEQSVPMSAAMDLNFAAQLQSSLHSHFMASLSNPAWLNSLGRQQGAGLGVTPPNTPQEADRRQRTPHGGIKTGDIGTNGKPSVKCPDCGKVLADPSSLYRHKKIHTGEKPHTCPFCPKDFIQRYNMKQHIRTHKDIPQQLVEAALADPNVGRNSKGNLSAQGPDAGPYGDSPQGQAPNFQ